ncbi:hypothetical protein [Paenibacillus silvestris]|uniref:hypothetical protein n=1 Tax=Paenibacillus silvestris TaxID=2606219 RepID=UPI001372F7CE|nr:hypothetical protein [Paenibacillus silvestris]
MITIRSVFVLLDLDSRDSIINTINSMCINYKDLQWIYKNHQDSLLYIEFNEKKSFLNEIEDTDENAFLLERIKSDVVLQIDISGRHPGDKEVLQIVKELLSKFNGYAMDDYSDHLWTLEEIQNGTKYRELKFFDYIGWYERNHNK